MAQPPGEPVDPGATLAAELAGSTTVPHRRSSRRATRRRRRAPANAAGTGLLLVPDSTSDRVMAFDPITGNLVDADFVPADPTNLATPKSAILSASGTGVLVADQIDDVVQEYDLDGNYVRVFAPAGGVNNAILDNILGIDLRPNGNLLVPVASGANPGLRRRVRHQRQLPRQLHRQRRRRPGQCLRRLAAGDRLAGPSIDSDNVLRYDSTGAPLGVFAPALSFGEQINGPATATSWSPTSATPNTGVMEFTPAGALVGVYSVVTGNRGVYELPNGNILTSNGSGVHEIDRGQPRRDQVHRGRRPVHRVRGPAGRTAPTCPTCRGSPRRRPPARTRRGIDAGAGDLRLDRPRGRHLQRQPVRREQRPRPRPRQRHRPGGRAGHADGRGAAPSITLVKTVGTTPGVCAATTTITVAPGTTVYYCYR